MNHNNHSNKEHKRYKKLKYKRTGQIFQEVYNILKMDVELDIANTNFTTNKNNKSEKKIKQLIKTLCCQRQLLIKYKKKSTFKRNFN